MSSANKYSPGKTHSKRDEMRALADAPPEDRATAYLAFVQHYTRASEDTKRKARKVLGLDKS